MRNMVSVLDPAAPKKPIFTDLTVGQMFKYGDSENVYMKIQRQFSDREGLGASLGAVLLNTGNIYFDVKDSKDISVVNEINIKR